MIEGMLDDLKPQVETAETSELEEEEGSSSSLGKDDLEGNDAGDENPANDASREQIKQQILIREEE